MAATAYAFVVSLMNTMDQIQIHPRLSTCFDNHQLESLRKNLDSLLAFVENHSDDSVVDAESSDVENQLMSRIATVAQLAEDLIEVEAADRIRDRSTAEKTQRFLLDLQGKIQEMESIINEEAVINKKEERPLQGDHLLPKPSSSTASPATSKSSTMIGFEGYINKLLDELSGYDCSRRILPIVGMGGVGKTTLARNVYENLLTVEHFVVRIWVTVSQTFTVSDIFLQALSCLGGTSTGNDTTSSDDELGERLHKNLYGRRYLIVLDDIWSDKAWERIKFYFPENRNGSRIVVTTRQQQLVDYFASSSSVAVDFLDNENSWKLFCDTIFGHEQGCCSCPPELQEVGQVILRRCRGLPLAITVIGGLLAKSPRTREYWEKIARDKSLILEHFSGNYPNSNPMSILYTSYKHLHVGLKSCFLYLGLFPEDHRINASKLAKFWIAEGFIKPNSKQSLEEVAESCMKELIDRNLLLVSGVTQLDKKVVTCYVHDLVREMCIRIAEKEKFYCVQRNIGGTCVFIVDERSASFYRPRSLVPTSKSPISLYHPLKLELCGQNGARLKTRLQRVMVNPNTINDVCEEVNLRFLCGNDFILTYGYHPLLPSSLSLFWSLQTIDFSCETRPLHLPIWNIPQLRHIDILQCYLSDPTYSAPAEAECIIVLHNLQTLKRVCHQSWSEEVIMRIPNVKELNFCNEGCAEEMCFDLHKLKNLESLACRSYIKDPLQNLKLPNSLRELSLADCRLAWSDVGILIGALRHLRILMLEYNAVEGAEWNLDEKVEFCSLEHLKISSGKQDLITWNANSSNFPKLKTLTLFRLDKLAEIPPDIREITTLERVCVDLCCESIIKSAIKALEEQQSLGNDDFQLELHLAYKSQATLWTQKIQKLGITSQNLHISSFYYHC